MKATGRRWQGSGTSGIWLLAALFGCACAGAPSPGSTTPAPPSATAATPANKGVSEPRSAQSAEPRTDPATLARLLSVRDEQGGAALVAELDRLPADPERAFALQELVFDLVTDLNDPGAADALATFLARPQQPRFETRAARALAALGDMRAVPFLGHRLRWDPGEIYSDARAWELPLRRDDRERVAAARLLAELAELHPWAKASIAELAEADLWYWLMANPLPHRYGMRALASLGSPEHVAQLRAWAKPDEPLPVKAQQPPLPAVWVVAESALRYLGQLRDPPSFSLLLQALERRPRDVDVSTEGIKAADVMMLAMSLRELGIGAAQGLSEWRDGQAFRPLLRYVEDPMNTEFARPSAGAALGWVGSDKELEQLATGIARAEPAVEREYRILCIIEGLRARPLPRIPGLLLPLLDSRQPVTVREAAARAMGRNRLDPPTQSKLVALLRRPELKTQAALALLLGGSTSDALTVIQSYYGQPQPPLAELKDAWSRSFGYFTRDDVANGTLFRYIENADAIAATLLAGEAQTWARTELGKGLQELRFDNGPHSVTRVMLNDQLRHTARDSDQRIAKLSIRAFALLGESGHLLHLSRATGPFAHAARQAYRAHLVENAGKPRAPGND